MKKKKKKLPKLQLRIPKLPKKSKSVDDLAQRMTTLERAVAQLAAADRALERFYHQEHYGPLRSQVAAIDRDLLKLHDTVTEVRHLAELLARIAKLEYIKR